MGRRTTRGVLVLIALIAPIAALTVATAAVAPSVLAEADERAPGPSRAAGVAAAHPVAHPENVPDPDVSWYEGPAPRGAKVLVGIIHALPPGRYPAVVLVPGTDGLQRDYLQWGRELAARGFDVAVGCWFSVDTSTDQTGRLIDCPSGPTFKGVTDEAVADLDALVATARAALRDPTHVALVGFSRGGGIVTLRAAWGRLEPVVSIAGMLTGTTAWGSYPGEVDVVERAGGIRAPVLLLHGTDDPLTPVGQAQSLEAELRDRGANVEAKYYAGQEHGMFTLLWVRADAGAVIATFLRARFEGSL